MGMNIYTLDGTHIGKRYANGIWCWDCKVRTRVEGNSDVCPNCGDISQEMFYNPALRELGFNKNPTEKTCIDGASGFIWQIGEYGLGETVREIKSRLRLKKYVKTEYGERWTIEKFNEMFLDIIEEKYETAEFS